MKTLFKRFYFLSIISGNTIYNSYKTIVYILKGIHKFWEKQLQPIPAYVLKSPMNLIHILFNLIYTNTGFLNHQFTRFLRTLIKYRLEYLFIMKFGIF